MANKKLLTYVSFAIGLLLVVSLIMNYSMATKLKLLENRVNDILNLQHMISSNIDNQTNQIENTLNEIEQQNTWLGHVEMEIISNDDSSGEAVFVWQVREHEEDSRVFFHYLLGDGDNFKTVTAKEIQEGFFQVEIPLEIEVEPHWTVSVYSDGGDSNSVTEESGFHTSKALQYYISMRNNDGTVKNGDIEVADVNELGSRKYGYIDTSIDILQNGIHITLAHFLEVWQKEVVQATLLKYENNRLLEEVNMDLDHSDEDMTMFILNEQKVDDNMRLVIKVEYSDGATFEKEIPL